MSVLCFTCIIFLVQEDLPGRVVDLCLRALEERQEAQRRTVDADGESMSDENDEASDDEGAE